jgi:hypothetical protein
MAMLPPPRRWGGKWRAEYAQYFAGRRVVLVPDTDQPGYRHMLDAARDLESVVSELVIIRVHVGKDLSELNAHGGLPDVYAILKGGRHSSAVRIDVAELERLAGENAPFSPLPNSENGENGEKPASGFRLTRLSDLLAEDAEEIAWEVEELLPTGGISILGAKPKVGKSTTARTLAFCAANGNDFLGRATAQGPIVYLALEEKRSEVAKHFTRMGATDEPIFIHVGAAPEEALAALTAAIAEHKPILAIVDPLLKLIRLRDANDYAEVSRSMEPLIELARRSGCHIMCVHHLGKGERTGGDAILGSTALFGAVDTAILMRRRNDQRVIESVQRYGTDFPETVVTLDLETGIVAAAGEVAVIEQQEMGEKILEAMGDEELIEPQIVERIGGNATKVAKAVRALVNEGKLVRSGGGKKGDPYFYRISVIAVETPNAPSVPSPQAIHSKNGANGANGEIAINRAANLEEAWICMYCQRNQVRSRYETCASCQEVHAE